VSSGTSAHPDDAPRGWRIRPAQASDAVFLERLAERLTIGIPPWRDPVAMAATARGWWLADLQRTGQDAAVYIAETDDETPIGAVAVARSQHFTGTPQAEIGELAVLAEWEGRGIAAALLAQAEKWAREAGLPYVSLATGAANAHALGFYARNGYQQEDIRLTKSLKEATSGDQ
jgi:ribosomal protein S18 acetylase RimI-like enzyme